MPLSEADALQQLDSILGGCFVCTLRCVRGRAAARGGACTAQIVCIPS